MSIRHEARGGLADGLKQSFTRKEAADWASDVGREMWLAGIQECLRLAKAYVAAEQRRAWRESRQDYDEIDWAKFEKQLEKL